LDGQTVCVTGTIVMYKGKPEIVITDPKQIGVSGKQ
jgi:DNA/RNA endonuclease YhcR with UshA esterase domain